MSYTSEECKWLLYYGKSSAKSTLRIDNDNHLDVAIHLMFDLLEEHTYIDRKEAERVFWNRIEAMTNRQLIK